MRFKTKKSSILEKIVFLFIVFSSSLHTFADNTDENNILFKPIDAILYVPQVEGCIRSKYEYNINANSHRFQVRNARFSVNGKLSEIIDYKAEIDLSDEGSLKMLDAWGRVTPVDFFSLKIGQQKVPFSSDHLRAPHVQAFANRSFISKQVCSGLRDVGATVSFKNKDVLPFDFFAGIYNGMGIYSQKEWQTDFNYALCAIINPIKNISVTLNYNSIKPEHLKINFFDVGLSCYYENFHFEAEYVHKVYENNVLDPTDAFLAFVYYDIPVETKIIKTISPRIRYDMMTDNNNGKAVDGAYLVDDIKRSRVTAGANFNFDRYIIIRLNYEKYFYDKDIENKDDKGVIEFVFKF